MQIHMAARLRERVQGILAQFDHRELTLTLLGMRAALHLVSQGLQEMVIDWVETLELREEIQKVMRKRLRSRRRGGARGPVPEDHGGKDEPRQRTARR